MALIGASREKLDTLAENPFLIPGIDPDSVSVSQLGVGPDGATTWAVSPLTDDPANGGIVGTGRSL